MRLVGGVRTCVRAACVGGASASIHGGVRARDIIIYLFKTLAFNDRTLLMKRTQRSAHTHTALRAKPT